MNLVLYLHGYNKVLQ